MDTTPPDTCPKAQQLTLTPMLALCDVLHRLLGAVLGSRADMHSWFAAFQLSLALGGWCCQYPAKSSSHSPKACGDGLIMADGKGVEGGGGAGESFCGDVLMATVYLGFAVRGSRMAAVWDGDGRRWNIWACTHARTHARSQRISPTTTDLPGHAAAAVTMAQCKRPRHQLHCITGHHDGRAPVPEARISLVP